VVAIPGVPAVGYHGVMSPGRDLLVTGGTKARGRDTGVSGDNLQLGLRSPSGVTLADLVGRWRIHFLVVGSGTQYQGWAHGTAVVGAAGDLTIEAAVKFALPRAHLRQAARTSRHLATGPAAWWARAATARGVRGRGARRGEGAPSAAVAVSVMATGVSAAVVADCESATGGAPETALRAKTRRQAATGSAATPSQTARACPGPAAATLGLPAARPGLLTGRPSGRVYVDDANLKSADGVRQLMAMSTSHQIPDGERYPAVLFTTALNDTCGSRGRAATAPPPPPSSATPSGPTGSASCSG